MILRLLILINMICGGTLASAAVYDPSFEYAAYNAKNGYETIVAYRKGGGVGLLLCNEVFPNGVVDPQAPNAVAKFAQSSCFVPGSAPQTGQLHTYPDTNYISGNTIAVVTIAQVFEFPDNSNDPGELGSQISTYKISTWAGNPVGSGDTIAYTGASIVHDHGATPKISTTRITFEMVGVTRKVK